MKWALVLVVALAACDRITVSALTVPPPGKIANLDSSEDDLQITLSRGIAIAFDCEASGPNYYGPCRNARATVDNDGVALVYKSYLDNLEGTWEDHGYTTSQSTRSAFVVVGLEVGETDLSLVTTDLDVGIHITVVP